MAACHPYIELHEQPRAVDWAVQDNAPWVLIKGSEEDWQKCGALLNACAGLCVLLAALVEPFMPSVTRKVHISAQVALLQHANAWSMQRWSCHDTQCLASVFLMCCVRSQRAANI